MANSTQAASGRAGATSQTERAEAIVEDTAERMGRGLSRMVTRAREEAEDIWAEAQDVRQRWDAAPSGPQRSRSGSS